MLSCLLQPLSILVLCQSLTRNSFVEGAPSCTLECNNGGYCKHGDADYSEFSNITKTLFSHIPFLNLTNHNFMHCVCPSGFIGIRCDIVAEKCGSGLHACFNGAKCVDDPSAERGYTCDCNQAEDAITSFSGHYCEHAATAMCEFGEVVSKHAFCTNGGECKDTIVAGQEHVGCDCPDGWEGRHCQFKKGTSPHSIAKSTASSKSESSSFVNSRSIIYLSIIIVISAGALFALCVVVRQKMRSKKEVDISTGTELELQADGSSTLPQTPTNADQSPIDGDAVMKTESGEEGEII